MSLTNSFVMDVGLDPFYELDVQPLSVAITRESRSFGSRVDSIPQPIPDGHPIFRSDRKG
jgi:hypothetical protein